MLHRVRNEARDAAKQREKAGDREPPSSMGDDLQDSGRRGGIARKVRQPGKAEEAALDPVPREQDDGANGRGEGDIQSAIVGHRVVPA